MTAAHLLLAVFVVGVVGVIAAFLWHWLNSPYWTHHQQLAESDPVNYMDQMLRARNSPPADSYPVAKITMRNGAMTARPYAPGLPDGEYDAWLGRS